MGAGTSLKWQVCFFPLHSDPDLPKRLVPQRKRSFRRLRSTSEPYSSCCGQRQGRSSCQAQPLVPFCSRCPPVRYFFLCTGRPSCSRCFSSPSASPWESLMVGKWSWELALAAIWLLVLKAGCYRVIRGRNNFPKSRCIRKDLAFLANEDSETNHSMRLMKLDCHKLLCHPPSSRSAYFSALTSAVTFLFLWYSNFRSRSPKPPPGSPTHLLRLPAVGWERCGLWYLSSPHRPSSNVSAAHQSVWIRPVGMMCICFVFHLQPCFPTPVPY